MSLLGNYKQKYATSISDVMNSSPAAKITGIATFGVAPALAAIGGNILEAGRAMFSDTGDPMALVKGKTQQVAGELSDFSNGKAGKFTVTPNPVLPISDVPAASTVQPAKPTTLRDGFTNGKNYLGKNRSDVAAQAALNIAKRKQKEQAGQTGTTAATPQPETPAVATDSNAAGSAISKIQEMDIAPTSEMLGNWNPAAGAGVAMSDGKAFMLAGRTPEEEKALQTSIASQQTSQPLAGITDVPKYVSDDQRQWQENQNIRNRLNALTPQNPSIMDVIKNNIALKNMKVIAQANQNDASANSLNIHADLAQREQPFKIANSISDTRYKNFLTDKGIVMTPEEIKQLNAATNSSNATTEKIKALLPGEIKKQDSDIRHTDANTNAINLETPAKVTEILARTAQAFASLKNPSKGDSQDAKYLQDRLMLYEKGIAEGTISLEQVPADIQAFWKHKKMTPGVKKS